MNKTSAEIFSERASWIFSLLLLSASALDSHEDLYQKAFLATAGGGMLVFSFVYRQSLNRDRNTDEKPLNFGILLFLSCLLTLPAIAIGGFASPYTMILLYPMIISSLYLSKKEVILLGLLIYLVFFLGSITSEESLNILKKTPGFILIQIFILIFPSYWISVLAQAFLKEKIEHDRVKHLDKEKNEFIGLASHHLRTPLSGINGYIDFFNSGNAGTLTNQQQEIVKRLHVETKKMNDIVENLIIAASMEQGRVLIRKKMDNLNQLLSSILPQFQSEAQSKDIQLVIDLPNEQINDIEFDSSKIRKVLTILLSNAFKFTNKGFVKVSAQNETKSVILSITDSGIGIKEEDMKNLFQRFSRAQSIMGNFSEEGMGLGLYIARLVIEGHGGKIWADSIPGQGSTFSFSLPRIK